MVLQHLVANTLAALAMPTMIAVTHPVLEQQSRRPSCTEQDAKHISMEHSAVGVTVICGSWSLLPAFGFVLAPRESGPSDNVRRPYRRWRQEVGVAGQRQPT